MSAASTVSEVSPRRDFELCKVVFGAAISQILYSRRALPPECFQLLPLAEVVSRPFEDIAASGSETHVHDNELLRQQTSTLFLRYDKHYGLNRFLGIMREDIFPLIENERLVKFRISYLRTKAWGQDSLVEYYTIAFKYEQNGSYVLDIWRAGTGEQDTATTDSQLWNLGDYLSRLPPWEGPLHWTLAFHATERPDEPPIGVWKFDRTDFDDANLELQQRAGYSYARVARLEIMPLPLAGVDEVIIETSPPSSPAAPVAPSPDPEPEPPAVEHPKTAPARQPQGEKKETSLHPEPELPVRREHAVVRPKTASASQPQGKRKQTQKSLSKPKSVGTGRRTRGTGAAQLSPPTTLASSRNVSNTTTADKGDRAAVSRSTREEISHGAESARNPGSRKGLAARRKPKRPVQLFEYAASSLPPTQIIGESQSLSQAARKEGSPLSHDKENGLVQARYEPSVPRSPSFDPSRLLDNISLSSEAVSATQSSPGVGLPQLPPPPPKTKTSMSGSRGLLRLGPSSVTSGDQNLTQHVPRASPPENLLGIELSDDEEETASEAEVETSPGLEKGEIGEQGITYDFSPQTVKRRTSIFYDISASSGGDEE